MPSIDSEISLLAGSQATYNAAQKDPNAVYFTTDTHKVYVGADEFTKGFGGDLTAEPTGTTVGEVGKFYTYNGVLWACTGVADGVYTWKIVANYNTSGGSVTKVGAGEGLIVTSIEGVEAQNPIQSVGNITHAVPKKEDATTVGSSEAQTPKFGELFNIDHVSFDKFGHVVDVVTSTVKLPAITNGADDSAEIAADTRTFDAISKVETNAETGEVVLTKTTYTLPEDKNTTYTFDSTEDGHITITPSEGEVINLLVHGWDSLAKKTDLNKIFSYKGVVATKADLPADGNNVGDVYHVVEKGSEYIWGPKDQDGTDIGWEELGSEIDLTAYALIDNVIARITGATAGHIVTATEDGQVADSGVALADIQTSIQNNTYTDATQENHGLMSATDKKKLDEIEEKAEVNKIAKVKVAGNALTPDDEKAVDVNLSDFGVTATAEELNKVTDKLSLTDGGTVAGATTFTQAITGDLTGNADSATKATQDADGNVISTTYATKEEVTQAASKATLKWGAIPTSTTPAE